MPRPVCKLNDVIGEQCRKQSRNNSVYCSQKCKNRFFYLKNKKDKPPVRPKETAAARGQHYEQFVKEYAVALENKKFTHQQVADKLEIGRSVVTKMYTAYLQDKEIVASREDWELSQETIKSLEDFKDFRDRYFKTETGDLYETADFHEGWINSIMDAIKNGGQQMILSPPRHGKTDLLTHFAVWQICKNPNIRIMWVGGNEDIAKNAVGSVLDQLENNELLIEEICGPGVKFQPKVRSGKSWSSGQFTVGTRSITGIKSPTMVAVGKGGKILSRDCDLIIADDIEDHSTTIQPSAREQTRQWWTTTLSSRKEEHTAVVVIGSRQHPEDLYNFLIENPQFDTKVEEAHSLECVLPETELEVHQDCMLWASKRTYKWLMGQKANADTTGGRAIFEMVYLNKAFVEGITMFNSEDIDQCRDVNRVIGQVPAGTHLIAGLDPASTGFQACFLWAANPDTGEMFLVDIENEQGGGVIQARKSIKKWHDKYGLAHWVIEENGFQKAIRQDTELKDYCGRNGIHLEGHQTQKNKYDPIYGVGSMQQLFERKLINLPYGDTESETKSNIYRRQLIYFSSAASRASKARSYKSDVVMASWFPMKVVRRLGKERLAEVGLDYEPSFGEWDITDMNESPGDRMTPEQLTHAITNLHFDNQASYSTRGRIRAIMNGGPDGIQALLGDNLKGFQDWQVPVPNLMMSGLEHLSQKIGRIPNLKVDVPNGKDSDRARQKAEKIGRIVNAYDEVQKLDLQMPQVGRWLPGYGFSVWVIREKKDANGTPYPCAELRDPYNCYPGYFGADQQPKDMAIVRRVPKEALARTYPQFANKIMSKDAYNTDFKGVGSAYASAYTDSYNGSWANSNNEGDLIAEYYNLEGTYIFHMTSATILDFIPNPLDSGPAFVIAKKFSFDRLQGQYDQIIGLMASMAKINVMSIIAMEDAVFTETNISGEIESGQYRKGRFAVNYLAPGTQVSKPASNVPYQIFQQIDRIERQLRVGGSYPTTDDSQSPLAFATGRGLEELGASMSLMIREYHTVMSDAIEMIDTKRLEWDAKMYGGNAKSLSGYMDNTFYSETYDPGKDITSYKTRRVYGAMAGYDEPQKIVTGLQLLQAGIIDKQTLQENLDGLDNLVRVNDRITKEKADNILFDTLLAQAQQGDPKATMAVVQIRKNPDDMQNILDKFFTAEEPEIPTAEQELLGGSALPPQGAPPGIAELLGGLGG